MTTVTIGKYYIKVEGHSGYDAIGKDIVCAAISTLIEATYNYLIATGNNTRKKEDDALYVIDNYVVNEAGKQIFDSYRLMIKDLAKQYPDYIKIEEEI